VGTNVASAQATRTWVSGVGDDANPCSRTAPCKTFAGAISKTAPGGEIDALDPGGFGALTITKSITIDGGGGQVASVLVAGTNGINVAAGASDVVILRNLRFDGLLGNGSNLANAGLDGINFTSGAILIIENCEIFGFGQNAIQMRISSGTSLMVVQNTTVANNHFRGIQINPTGGGSTVSISKVWAYKNGAAGVGTDTTGGGVAVTNIDQLTASENPGANGIEALGNGTTVQVSNSVSSHNGVGISVSPGANMFTYQNNVVNGNGTNVSGTLLTNTFQ
jgi:hypothetical protein